MIYKLYISTYHEEIDRAGYIAKFTRFYKENNVIIIGSWVNKENPLITYYITGYRSETHYNNFVKKMKLHPDYQKLTDSLSKSRKSVETVTMELAENPMIKPDEFDLLEYTKHIRDQYV